jgi:hypothetical protein
MSRTVKPFVFLAMSLVLVGLVLSAPGPQPSTELAARYHARNRTSQFFKSQPQNRHSTHKTHTSRR